MPRRSRRSPRHLRVVVSVVVAIVTSVIQPSRQCLDRSVRVSGTGLWQSLDPLSIVRPQDVQVEEQREQEEVHVSRW